MTLKPNDHVAQRAYMVSKKVPIGPNRYALKSGEFELHWHATPSYPYQNRLEVYLRDGITGGDVFYRSQDQTYWLWWVVPREIWLGPFVDPAAVTAAFTLLQP